MHILTGLIALLCIVVLFVAGEVWFAVALLAAAIVLPSAWLMWSLVR